MPNPHRTFFYLFEDYKNNIFREWWQKGEGRKLKWYEIVMLALFTVCGVATLVLYCVTCICFPKDIWIPFIPAVLTVILAVIIAIYTDRRNRKTLDEEAEQYYERKVKRLYDRLHEQDYDNRLSLDWIIQKCQEIIDRGSGLENALKSFGRYFVVCILPILSFCASAILNKLSVAEQCAVGATGVLVLLSIFALSRMINPEFLGLGSKRIRIAKELKASAEYLLVQGDLEITDKPRVALKREAASIAL